MSDQYGNETYGGGGDYEKLSGSLEVKRGQGIGDTTQIPQVGEKIESTFNPNITGGGVDQLTKYLINISENLKSTDEVGKWARSVSLGDMFAASQRQTNKEALEAAQFFLQEFGPIIKTSDGKIINNPKYLPATSITINQMMNKNGEAVFNLSAALHNGIVGKNPDLVKSIKNYNRTNLSGRNKERVHFFIKFYGT